MMHNLMMAGLLTSIAFAAADKPGGGSSPADDARAKAQEARDKQEAAEKAKSEKAAQEAGGGQSDAQADAQDKGLAPPVDVEGLDPKALLARLDAQDRLIQTLTAQMKGGTGPALDEAKDVAAASPGAQFDPRLTRTLPPGVSSAPSMQPMPAGDGGLGGGLVPLGGSALWGETSRGGPVQARAYPQLDEEDVVVTATGYHDDTIRNAGDTIVGYTGPAASWFVPVDLVKKLGSLEDAARDWRRRLADFAARAAA